MSFAHYIRSGQRLLRCGYTTGTCAALAAQGAAVLLLSEKAPQYVEIKTPKGVDVRITPVFCRMEDGYTAICGVEKDAGDDSDATDGILIAARVRRADSDGVAIDGGVGIGRVTKPGLDQPVGAAAINSAPRKMIRQQIEAVSKKYNYAGGISVEIFAPDDEEIALRTFNPQLGVEGGISVLGTSGIVEPMSEQALKDTIELQIRQSAVSGAKRLVLTPGNYGMDFLRSGRLNIPDISIIKCSNFIGDALDVAAGLAFEEVLLVGHIGKLVKTAGGIMNTHSAYADCRAEIFCAHAAVCGASAGTCRDLMNAATTDACIDILEKANLREKTLDSIFQMIQHHLDRRAAGAFKTGAVLFSNKYGLLGTTEKAEEIIMHWQE